MSNCIHHNVWDGMLYPFPNFSSCTIEVWEWISNFISHFTGHVITYPCWDLKLKHVSKRGPGHSQTLCISHRSHHYLNTRVPGRLSKGLRPSEVTTTLNFVYFYGCSNIFSIVEREGWFLCQLISQLAYHFLTRISIKIQTQEISLKKSSAKCWVILFRLWCFNRDQEAFRPPTKLWQCP